MTLTKINRLAALALLTLGIGAGPAHADIIYGTYSWNASGFVGAANPVPVDPFTGSVSISLDTSNSGSVSVPLNHLSTNLPTNWVVSANYFYQPDLAGHNLVLSLADALGDFLKVAFQFDGPPTIVTSVDSPYFTPFPRPLTSDAANASGSFAPAVTPAPEIGRASCRERG